MMNDEERKKLERALDLFDKDMRPTPSALAERFNKTLEPGFLAIVNEWLETDTITQNRLVQVEAFMNAPIKLPPPGISVRDGLIHREGHPRGETDNDLAHPDSWLALFDAASDSISRAQLLDPASARVRRLWAPLREIFHAILLGQNRLLAEPSKGQSTWSVPLDLEGLHRQWRETIERLGLSTDDLTDETRAMEELMNNLPILQRGDINSNE